MQRRPREGARAGSLTREPVVTEKGIDTDKGINTNKGINTATDKGINTYKGSKPKRVDTNKGIKTKEGQYIIYINFSTFDQNFLYFSISPLFLLCPHFFSQFSPLLFWSILRSKIIFWDGTSNVERVSWSCHEVAAP